MDKTISMALLVNTGVLLANVTALMVVALTWYRWMKGNEDDR